MKIFKAIIMSIGIAAAAMTAPPTASAQSADDFVAMLRQKLEYKGTEWSVIPLDEDYEEKIYFLWSDNKKGDAAAKIIIPEFEGGNANASTTLLLTNVDCKYIKTLKIKVGGAEYNLRKIEKGQARDKDTFFADYSVFPKKRNIYAELLCHGADSGTMIGLNRTFPSMLDVKNPITIEVPFEDGTFTFTFSPTKAVK